MDVLETARATHAKHHKSVVAVIKRCQDSVGVGTGFIIKSTESVTKLKRNLKTRIVVMTCQHCVVGGESLYIRLPGSSREYEANLLHQDEESDLALLVTMVDGAQPVLEFRETSSDIGIDSLVFLAAYYNPDPKLFKRVVVCLNPTIHPGKICGPLAESKENPVITNVPHSCRSQGGCSGGPLIFNSQAIGVHFETAEQMEYARSSDTVRLLMRKWLQIANNIDPTIHQMVERI